MTSNNAKNLVKNKPSSLFTPSIIRSITDDTTDSSYYTISDAESISDTSIDNTGSFKYTLPETGLRSTQQLNISWSQFSNHTFFNSAQVKVNVAFDKIQNQFPFDGTKKEFEIYLDGLTGYEKYVLDNYPKYRGYLYFSGTNGETSGGTYVTVKDIAGSAFPDSSRRTDGLTVISPEESNSLTAEYWIWIPSQANDNQIILDKHSGSMGFMITLDSSVSTTTATTTFRIISGSITSNLSTTFTKNQWNHMAWTWDRAPKIQNISAYVNAVLQITGSTNNSFDTMPSRADMYIGSGSTLGSFSPANTLSGALDELRIWHSVRTANEIKEYQRKNIFAQPELKLYYRFNEASGSSSPLVIDASSNSVHGRLSTSAVLLGVRQIATASIAGSTPMTFENQIFNPILFPTQPDVTAYRTTLLTSASLYDDRNPNIITRLIPKHYLTDGQLKEALGDTEEGPILTDLVTGTDPRTTNLGGTQVLLLMLYCWAKYFDELKLYTQAFADILFVDYDNIDTVPDQFLQQLARSKGFELPAMFAGSTVPQFIEGNNIDNTIGISNQSLQQIQNQIWRRILINLRDIVQSKGTIHSVKSLIRATGIDPDNNFIIREYGGPTKRNLSYARDTRNEVSTMLEFVSGGIILSPYLSSSRVEPGYPYISGTMVSGTSIGVSDGLLTSGSWTFESTYKFPKNRTYISSQSLARFQITGSIGVTSSLILNCVAVTSSNLAEKTVTIFAKPNQGNPGNSALILSVTGVDIFDGNQWYVSFGRQRNDDIGDTTTRTDSLVSSSYFLRVAKSSFGTVEHVYSTASYYNDNQINGPRSNMFAALSSSYNASGTYIAIGSQSIDTSSNNFLNSTANAPQASRASAFQGKISQIRFWSKCIKDDEWLEHVKDFRSVGVQDPLTNFNFVTNKSGSYEKLRIDAATDQIITASTAGGLIDIFDFTQNNYHMSGTGFPATTSVIVPERFFYSYISPRFDEASTTEKVRVRSFKDFSNVQSTPWADLAPVYEVRRSELPTDNTRFTIDFSVVDTLNQDIMTIFSTLDSMDNILGNPELMFSPDYPGLENMRTVYFNKLTGRVNLKTFFSFFKWFDHNIGVFINQIIPRKTKFLGINFIISSHVLERGKLEYYSGIDSYLGESNRNSLKDTILLSQFVATATRY